MLVLLVIMLVLLVLLVTAIVMVSTYGQKDVVKGARTLACRCTNGTVTCPTRLWPGLARHLRCKRKKLTQHCSSTNGCRMAPLCWYRHHACGIRGKRDSATAACQSTSILLASLDGSKRPWQQTLNARSSSLVTAW